MTGTDPAGGPIFVAGCGRSGTSFVRTLLDAHPDVYIPSETLCLVDYLQAWDRLPPRLREWLFFHEPQLRCWYTGPAQASATAAATIARTHEHEATRHGARVWGQKTPRFVRHIDLFRQAYPDARWVLLYRDPRAVVASMVASGQHTNSVVTAVDRWRRDNAPIVDDLRRGRSSPDVLLVQYETLVVDFAATLARIWRFLDLPPVDEEQLLADARPVFFSRSRFPINTVRDGMRPNPAHLDTWRSRLSPAQVAHVERACAAEMEVMGYAPSAPATAEAIGPVHRLVDRLRDVVIPLRYAWYWPEYPAFVALRQLALALGRAPVGPSPRDGRGRHR